MGITKGFAFFGVVLVGFGLFATIIYQSGLLQKLEKNNSVLALKVTGAKELSKKPENKASLPLTNPNGDTAIAIIRHHRPLENAILDALKEGAFASKF